MTEYEDWINNIKVGDKVAYDIGGRWERDYFKIYTVERLTKTLIITNGGRFRKDGTSQCSDSWKKIRPVDEYVAKAIIRRRTIAKFKEAVGKSIEQYTTEQLEAVVKILSAENNDD